MLLAVNAALFPPADLTCDARLTKLYTPLRPQLGMYEVCTSAEPLGALAAAAGWPTEALPPLDALGGAGLYDRAAVSRLFGGRRAVVARGWRREAGRFESITLVSPYPDPALTALVEGTLVIRYFLPE